MSIFFALLRKNFNYGSSETFSSADHVRGIAVGQLGPRLPAFWMFGQGCRKGDLATKMCQNNRGIADISEPFFDLICILQALLIFGIFLAGIFNFFGCAYFVCFSPAARH